MKRGLRVFLLGGMMAAVGMSFSQADALSAPDIRYLKGLLADTWRCLDRFVSPRTGLPYDSHERLPNTSITNIGFYMAACAVAGETGLLPRDEALAKTRKTLESLGRVERWRGFPVTWVEADTGKTTEQQFSTVDHLGNLSASLILVRQIFPELRPEADALLSGMDWGIIYEPRNHLYRGGYRLDKKDFDIQQPWGDWYYGFLGADTRLGSFLGVASGRVPLDHWAALDRKLETKYGQTYYVPGWQGGGLFMQYVSGLFLDERATVVGKSAANFAYAQILHAEAVKTPVWGWSAAAAPTGEYLGWGAIKDDVVTPHACVLAVSHYPRSVTANLRELERRGARAPFIEDGISYALGFRDSLDWRTGQVAKGYLILDQAMLFLALANFLHDGVVWKHFENDPLVQKGLDMLPEYKNKDPRAGAVFQRRDQGRRRDVSLPL